MRRVDEAYEAMVAILKQHDLMIGIKHGEPVGDSITISDPNSGDVLRWGEYKPQDILQSKTGIEWLKIDPNNPPKTDDKENTKFLFCWDHSIFSGWPLQKDEAEGFEGVYDDEGYPCWETSEFNQGVLHGVRWYAVINYPPKEA